MVVGRPGDDRKLELDRGDEIRTEISCKFTCSSFCRRLAATGLVLDRWWSDPGRRFALALLQPGEHP
jgi:L-histidine N-alpha-methyltransferase